MRGYGRAVPAAPVPAPRYAKWLATNGDTKSCPGERFPQYKSRGRLKETQTLDRRERNAAVERGLYWSERQDSNLRTLAPHASALPDCATLRPGGIIAGSLSAAGF